MIFEYYKKSAKMSDDGINNIGICYFREIRVEKDEKKAFEHLKKSAEMCFLLGIAKEDIRIL